MRNGWTGGQYSLFRAIFGLYLFIHFCALVPWGPELFSNRGALPEAAASPLIHLFPNVLAVFDGALFVQGLIIVAAFLSLLFASGQWDRIAALVLWYLWACLLGRNPLISNPSIPYVGWLLLVHVFLPPAPYGSWTARARRESGTSWRMPESLFLLAWVLMALWYSYGGYTKLVSPSWLDGTALARILESPLTRPGFLRETLLALPETSLRLATWGALGLELLFAPLAMFRRLRPWIWSAMLGMHLGLLLVIDFADLTFGMVILHLFTFDPAWFRPTGADTPELLFYDGRCGLCHGVVRFVLTEHRGGVAFRFAPLEGETFRAMVPAAESRALPDSLVLRTTDGHLLTRSAAVLRILRRLGGVWRLIAAVVELVPASVRDRWYDAVARTRHSLFRRPPQACPVVPEHLRGRFCA